MKKVLIIGASSGIGRALALKYAKKDCEVVITARRTEQMKELSTIENISYEYMDITDINATMRKMQELVEGTDITIISAGIGDINSDLNFELEYATTQTNVCGFLAVVNVVFNYYKKNRRGHIVAISSVAAIRGSDLAPAYNASKAYVRNYMEGLRKKSYKENLQIHITTILPGLVKTRMAKGEGLFWVEDVDEIAEEIIRGVSANKAEFIVSRRWNIIGWLLKILPDKLYNKIG